MSTSITYEYTTVIPYHFFQIWFYTAVFYGVLYRISPTTFLQLKNQLETARFEPRTNKPSKLTKERLSQKCVLSWCILLSIQWALLLIKTIKLFFCICLPPGLLPVLGPREWYMTHTLDSALLCSSRAGTDLGLTSDRFIYSFFTAYTCTYYSSNGHKHIYDPIRIRSTDRQNVLLNWMQE